MKQSRIFEIYEDRNRCYTKNIARGASFDEYIIREGGAEYREFDPRRSKLAAAIMKGCPNVSIRNSDIVLYLGASHGYTVSFVSDMVGKDGFIFAVDSAPRVVRDLVFLCERRKNIAPVLADANHPEEYSRNMCQVDVVYQDIAQRNQVEIFLKNCAFYLKEGGYALLAVKSRSIDVAALPKNIYRKVREELEKEMIVIDYRVLDPFEKDHALFVCKKK